MKTEIESLDEHQAQFNRGLAVASEVASRHAALDDLGRSYVSGYCAGLALSMTEGMTDADTAATRRVIAQFVLDAKEQTRRKGN